MNEPLRAPSTVFFVLTIVATILVAGCTSDDSKDYNALFTEKGETPMIEQGSTQEGKTTSFEFDVNTTNVTKVELSLSWFDDSNDGCDDLLEMTVVSASPSARYIPSQTQQGTKNIEITVEVASLPSKKSSPVRNEMERYLERSTSIKGQGIWKVSITCVDSQPGCPDPKALDNGNGWALTATVFYFDGMIS